METSINTDLIIRKAKTTEKELLILMQRLQQKEIITYTSKGADSSLTFNEVREDDLTINRVAVFLEQQNKVKLEQFQAIVNYVENTNRCKSRLLLDYFDEKESTDCGICSYCINKNKKPKSITNLAELVLTLLENASYSSREIEQKLELTPKETVYILQVLLENEKIKLNINNQYTIK